MFECVKDTQLKERLVTILRANFEDDKEFVHDMVCERNFLEQSGELVIGLLLFVILSLLLTIIYLLRRPDRVQEPSGQGPPPLPPAPAPEIVKNALAAGVAILKSHSDFFAK